MTVERPLVWLVAVLAVTVTLASIRYPPAPSDQTMVLFLATVVALPLAFVFARLLLAIPERRRGW